MKIETVRTLSALYVDMFGFLPSEENWADYPLEVVLYALSETKDKVRRTPTMTDTQVFNFASTIMERRDRELVKKARREGLAV